MLKRLFERFRKKSEMTPLAPVGGTNQASMSEESRSVAQKSHSKMRLLAIGAAAILTVTVGFVTSATVLRFLHDNKEQPTLTIGKMADVSNLPKRQATSLHETLKEDAPHSPGEHPAVVLQNDKETSAPQEASRQSHANQEQQVKLVKKEAGSRPVAEFDPFKAEFQKKYEEAEKKEKKALHRNSDGQNLTKLEEMIKTSTTKSSAPVVQFPPAQPTPKELRLNVYGVVVSKKDTYALTDRGVIRMGSNVDTFKVERIEFDAVTLISKENDKDVRNISITGRGSQSGTATPPVVPLTVR